MERNVKWLQENYFDGNSFEAAKRLGLIMGDVQALTESGRSSDGAFNEETVEVGGREVGAFAELSKCRSNRILAVYPIPVDGGEGWTFSGDSEGSLHVWGVQSDRGKRIAEAYQSGELPCDDRDKINRVLRPDEFD